MIAGRSLRTRLIAGCVLLLGAATAVLAVGTWALFRASILRAADDSLAARIDGAARFIAETQHELPHEDLRDEFDEFVDLTHGEVLLQVSDQDGQILSVPAIPEWSQLRAATSPAGRLRPEPREVDGSPFRAVSTELTIDGRRYRVWAAIPMSTAYAALVRFDWLLGGLVPLVLVCGVGGAAWISRRALAPIDRMTRDARAISLRHLDRRLEVPAADDELRRLAITFNDVMARLERSVADMVRFTADASHELRTPVALTRTTAELSLARERTPDEYRDALKAVLGHTERISALVNDLFALARADAGVEAMPFEPLDLCEVAADAARDVRELAERRMVALEFACPASAIRVQGSAESLRRLFLILLDNAVHYTAAGGSIRMSVSTTDARSSRLPGTSTGGMDAEPAALVEVVDSGIGLTSADAARAFERFYRGVAARQTNPDGSGLGLAIARTIVERHNGEISLSPGPGGVGCHVQVRLGLQ